MTSGKDGADLFFDPLFECGIFPGQLDLDVTKTMVDGTKFDCPMAAVPSLTPAKGRHA
jgi:hypothetical protein